MAVGEDYYFSDTDDDDDVDRYVFLARQPVPARRHAEGDATDEDDDEETEDERLEDGGLRKGKRPLRDVPDSPPPPKKKARVGVISSQSAARTLMSGTDQSASSPSGVRDRESGGSEESGEAAHERRPDPRKGKAKIKTKKPQGVCGKRKTSPFGEEADDHQEPRRDVTAAAKTSPSSTATSAGRFLCNLCDRCFDSHQALGGHVLGHRKKAKIAIAAAASLSDDGCSGNRKEEVAAVLELIQEDANGVIGHAERKTSVAVAAPDTGDNGNYHKKKKKNAIDDVDDAACHEDADRDGHKKAKKKKPSVVAEDHMGAHGDGNTDMSSSMFAASHEGVNNEHDRNREKASGRSFHNGNEETAIIGAGSHNDGDVKNKKAAIGASRKGAAASGNSNVDACKTQHRCKVCGTECATGWALGGHMRRHRKQPAHGAEGDGTSVTDVGDSLTPVSRQFGATGLQRALVVAGETSG